MGAFGFGWKDATAVQTYTIHDFHHVFADALVRRGAARAGLTWHFARPPVIDLEYEMDCRTGVAGSGDLADPHPEEPRERRLEG